MKILAYILAYGIWGTIFLAGIIYQLHKEKR